MSLNAAGKRRALLPSDPTAHPSSRAKLESSLLASRYSSFSYTTPLLGHHSCVNALSFSGPSSSGLDAGKWLGSGGDDLSVRVWNTLGAIKGLEPSGYYDGARSNIFSISFTCDGTKVLSGGNDSRVLMHDLEVGASSSGSRLSGLSSVKTPAQMWMDHDASIRRVHCHPSNPHLFLTASEDGTVKQFDTRTRASTSSLYHQGAFNDVQYHPRTPANFVTANACGSVMLHDARMAFLGEQTPAEEVAIFNYDTHLVRPIDYITPGGEGHEARVRKARPDPCSVTFDETGQLLVVTYSRSLPTLYELSDTRPLATFSSPATGVGREGYSNSCTIKNGSFGGTPESLYYAAGSDDFGAYIWSVPDLALLRSRRVQTSPNQTTSWPETTDGTYLTGFGPLPPDDEDSEHEDEHEMSVTVPHSISTPSTVIRSHRSIVNTALFHPRLPLLFTCGIEKVIHVHSSTSFDSNPVPTVHEPRQVGGKRLRGVRRVGVPGDPAGKSAETEEMERRQEDLETLEHFDHLLAEEDNRGDDCLFESDFEPETDEDEEERIDTVLNRLLGNDEGSGTDGEDEEGREARGARRAQVRAELQRLMLRLPVRVTAESGDEDAEEEEVEQDSDSGANTDDLVEN